MFRKNNIESYANKPGYILVATLTITMVLLGIVPPLLTDAMGSQTVFTINNVFMTAATALALFNGIKFMSAATIGINLVNALNYIYNSAFPGNNYPYYADTDISTANYVFMVVHVVFILFACYTLLLNGSAKDFLMEQRKKWLV